ASLMVLGFEPLDKPIIPRRSFFDKDDFLALTGMFTLTNPGSNCLVASCSLVIALTFFVTSIKTLFNE
ncbi:MULTISPECIES: hypothetical protein, partial [unclassified Paenibacillus]|uniref:hypothetical protein n=1 Tax=unclassified Paenibacillus TaxID=185978 RepID=UPI0036327B0E